MSGLNYLNKKGIPDLEHLTIFGWISASTQSGTHESHHYDSQEINYGTIGGYAVLKVKKDNRNEIGIYSY